MRPDLMLAHRMGDGQMLVGFPEQETARVAVADLGFRIEAGSVVPPLIVGGRRVDPDDELDTVHDRAPKSPRERFHSRG